MHLVNTIVTMTILKENIPVGIAADHAGFALKQFVVSWLEQNNIPYHDFGTYTEASMDYPDTAHPLAEAVEQGRCYPGIAICGSGNGIAITLNKHQGVRAALSWSADIGELARAHNDANVLVMPGRYIDNVTAQTIVEKFFSTPFEGGRHKRRIEKIPVQIG